MVNSPLISSLVRAVNFWFRKNCKSAAQLVIVSVLAAAALPVLAGPVYNGGPVMTGTSNVHYLWYGDWSTDTAAFGILNNLVADLSGSSYFNINSTYDTSTDQISTSLNMAGNAFISSTANSSLYLGNSLDGYNKATFTDLINSALSNNLFGHTGYSTNDIYYVLTASDISVNGFGTRFCGWHSSTAGWGTGTSLDMQYGFIGNAAGSSGCTSSLLGAGISDLGADAMASVVAHELSETVTDPTGTAWWDSTSSFLTGGYENADMCAWQFGSTYATSSGGNANVSMNGHDYLLQQNWINTGNGTGSCGLSYEVAAVPEPASLALLGIGLLGLAGARRRKC